MSELLPCPFCGGEAEMLTAESMNGGYLFGIMCNDCRSRGDVYDTEAEAIAAWNSRAERTCRMFPSDYYPCAEDDCMRLSMRMWTCSECEADNFGIKPNFCPFCGAKVVSE